MTRSDLFQYFSLRDISLAEGLSLIERSAKEAANTRSMISAALEGKLEKEEIVFYANAGESDIRRITMKDKVVKRAGKILESLVYARQIAKRIGEYNRIKGGRQIVSGTILDQTDNGWFVSLPNIRGFMPQKEAIDRESAKGLYETGNSLLFAVSRSYILDSGKPRIILSRRSPVIARTIAMDLFSIYGFISVKRIAGVKQTILVRAYPQKERQLQYRSYFGAERIFFHKLLSSGEIQYPSKKDKR